MELGPIGPALRVSVRQAPALSGRWPVVPLRPARLSLRIVTPDEKQN